MRDRAEDEPSDLLLPLTDGDGRAEASAEPVQLGPDPGLVLGVTDDVDLDDVAL